jgi:hypothetical protein
MCVVCFDAPKEYVTWRLVRMQCHGSSCLRLQVRVHVRRALFFSLSPSHLRRSPWAQRSTPRTFMLCGHQCTCVPILETKKVFCICIAGLQRMMNLSK